jgi:hypothetical protein
MRMFRRARAPFGLGLLLSLTLAPGAASAQQVSVASDGQTFQTQSQRTQQTFTDTFGASCAAQEWVWQHSAVVDDTFLSGPPAKDGQALASQDDDARIAFVAVWGRMAVDEWLAEHNAIVAHRVLPAPVGPVPCPATRTTRQAIETAHLDEAIASARNGNLPDAHGALNKFRDVWTTTRDDIRKKSPVVAETVQTAYDQAAAIISDPKAPVPTQSQYQPALENLLKVVQNADALLDPTAR